MNKWLPGFLLGIFFFTCSCSERYKYLSKLKVPAKRGTVTIHIHNQSPQWIQGDFETELRNYCIKRLNKEGYRYTEKDPQYEVNLDIQVDSSMNQFIGLAGNPFGKFNPQLQAFSRKSRGIELHLELNDIRAKRKLWNDQYDLFFFDDYKRDLFRTKGVIKYMLTGINREN